MSSYSDFIVYADESGSPVLDGIDPDYPVFVLVFLLVSKMKYTEELVPSLQKIKFDFTGHDQLILHERDIRRQSNDFTFLRESTDIRAGFLGRINDLVDNADVEIIASVIHKDKLTKRYSAPWSPYNIALRFCMERLCRRLLVNQQKGRVVHCVFESRGAKEDKELELSFHRIAQGNDHFGGSNQDFEALNMLPVFADKRSNSAGLQLADLFARPIGLKQIRPDQHNRAFDIIAGKIPKGGLKSFP